MNSAVQVIIYYRDVLNLSVDITASEDSISSLSSLLPPDVENARLLEAAEYESAFIYRVDRRDV
jgi:hypothetical protein